MSSGHQPISPYDNVSLAQSLTESCSIELDFTQVQQPFFGHYEKHTNIANLKRKNLKSSREKYFFSMGTNLVY